MRKSKTFRFSYRLGLAMENTEGVSSCSVFNDFIECLFHDYTCPLFYYFILWALGLSGDRPGRNADPSCLESIHAHAHGRWRTEG